MTTDNLIEELTRLEKAATPRPWQAMREGNQYVDCKKITPTPVGASRVHGVQRPWNPYAAAQFGLTPEHHEAVRFKDDDADLVVTLCNHLPAILSALKENKRLREALTDLVSAVDDGEHDHSNVENEPCQTCSAWLRASAALQPQGEK